ncbi:hypothetical protein QNN00_16935 [Bacillus velezensis]|nr:hypothetical protein [Bacillus velezensis]
MHSDIIGVDSDKDGRKNVRAWIRTNEKQETVLLRCIQRTGQKGKDT